MTQRVVALIQARTSSSRFPQKVLADLNGQAMILSMLERVAHAKRLNDYVVVTSTDASDDVLVECLLQSRKKVFRGSLNDVLNRFKCAAEAHPAEIFVRLTGDCPLIDPFIIDRVVSLMDDPNIDYASNIDPPRFADGLDVEAFRNHQLMRAHELAAPGPEREHVTLWMRSDGAGLRRANLAGVIDSSHIRLTVDYPDDLEEVRAIVAALGNDPPSCDHFAILRYLDSRGTLAQRNKHNRNEALS